MLRLLSAFALVASSAVLVAAAPVEAGVVAMCDGQAATIVDPTVGPDDITGTPRRDVIVAHGGDTIHARGGNDLVCVYADGALRARVFLESGADTARVTGDGEVRVFGGDGNDVITSTSTGLVRTWLDGGSGADRLRTSAGPALMHGGLGNDILRGGPSADALWGDAGADQLMAGGEGKDFAIGGSGNDRVTAGGATRDVVGLGTGDDVLTGSNAHLHFQYTDGPIDHGVVVNLALGRATGQGSDRFSGVVVVTGTLGDDRLLGSYRAERITGGQGNDTIEARGGADEIFPQGGQDTVLAGKGDDIGYFKGDEVWLGPGADNVGVDARAHVRGGSGNDQFMARLPKDLTLWGGPGVDTLGFEIGFVWPEPLGATVNLTTGHGSVGAWLFDFFDVENVSGTKFADMLVGDDGPNLLAGLGENDTIDGQGGLDTADGGEGTDSCTAETVLNCE